MAGDVPSDWIRHPLPSAHASPSRPIGRNHVVDLIVGYRRPYTVHLNLVVVANHTTLGRPTIHQIAARALAIVSFELRVEALMPMMDLMSLDPSQVVMPVRASRLCSPGDRHGP